MEFESSIELMHKKASDEKLILSKEIDGLKELNYTMNEETKKLTKALSHEAKVKGNWGELILEKISGRKRVKTRERFQEGSFFEPMKGRRGLMWLFTSLKEGMLWLILRFHSMPT